MAGPSAIQQLYLDELECHIAALSELLDAYEHGLRNALSRNDRPLIRTLTWRIEYTTEALRRTKRRRTALTIELQTKTPA